MNALLKFLTVLDSQLKRLGICATTGFIGGAIAGFFLLLLFLANGGTDPALTVGLFWRIVLVLTLFDFAALLFLLVGLCHYSLASVWLPILINALLTCFTTTLLVSVFKWWLGSIIVGMLVGLAIGRLLCILSCRFMKR